MSDERRGLRGIGADGAVVWLVPDGGAVEQGAHTVVHVPARLPDARAWLGASPLARLRAPVAWEAADAWSAVLLALPELRAGAPRAAEPADPSPRELLRLAERAASWHGAEHRETRRARDEALRRNDAADVERAIARGARSRALLQRLYDVALARGAGHPEVTEARRRFEREFRYLTREADKQVSAADAARRRRAVTTSSVRAGDVPREIHRLAPSPAWTLLIDETGRRFAEEDDGPEGRFVGLLVPEGCAVTPPPPGFHAVDADAATNDRVVQAVLDAPVGVFGVGLSAVPPAPGDRWVAGVLEVVHWVLRLLPVHGRTRLDVLVEQRGAHRAQADWQALVTEAGRHLAEINPARYRQIALDLRVVAKDAHPLNGSVDALAFMWGSRAPAARARLRQSGLTDGCLHGGSPVVLRRAWDLLGRGTALDGATWAELAWHPDAGGIAGLLLDQVGAAAREDVALWSRYLDAAVDHLESKGVRMGALGRQVAWLEAWQPQGAVLPPKLRLAWLVARLEHDNHLGAVDGEVLAELESLGARLFDEAPALVCQADLDRAVLATNRFDFAGATAALARFADVPPAVPGLQHWGRVRSSLGQHAAFRGEPAKAEVHFTEAVAAFARLSDERVAAGEVRHTATYRAFAALDRRDLGAAARRALVAAVVDLTPDAIAALARSVEPATRHGHHLLVRYLCEHGRPDEVDAYLGARRDWRVGEGHPWALIRAGRAVLLAPRDAAAAREEMARAASLALDGGPTLCFIGAALAMVAARWGAPPAVDAALLDELAALLPGAPVDALRRALAGEGSPLAALRTLLPFNFR